MGCTPIKNTPPTRDEFALWQSMGYTGNYADYRAAKDRIGEYTGYLSGPDLPICPDCGYASENLCDYPVGDDKTCDRPMCFDHSHKVGPNMHYCETHFQMWQAYCREKGIKSLPLEDV